MYFYKHVRIYIWGGGQGVMLITVKTVYNSIIGSNVLYCYVYYSQVAVVTSTFCTETSETVPNMCP